MELKRRAYAMRATQAVAELLSASADSLLPVLSIATDLNQTYFLYWLAKDDAGLMTVYSTQFFRAIGMEFLALIRAFIAGSMMSSPYLRPEEREPWMRKDSGFDPNYDSSREGRKGRLHRVRTPFPNEANSISSDMIDDAADDSGPLPERISFDAVNWNCFGTTFAERTANIYALFEKYEGKSLREARDQMRQEALEEDRGPKNRLNVYTELMGKRIGLMSR